MTFFSPSSKQTSNLGLTAVLPSQVANLVQPQPPYHDASLSLVWVPFHECHVSTRYSSRSIEILLFGSPALQQGNHIYNFNGITLNQAQGVGDSAVGIPPSDGKRSPNVMRVVDGNVHPVVFVYLNRLWRLGSVGEILTCLMNYRRMTDGTHKGRKHVFYIIMLSLFH